ncbi:transcription/translation regulatory transformer protein RfaH [Leucothrix arctica]|uniref:Transcription/translation regulatory transformer protein RfaH n=1 Tax=Leucothrix arctica TaxID=1481894 RepID=A0A317CKJ1_9GAMM|nr:transcription/translation regulatory transformer protein RfaH [Leucothrix arctica]PWQ98707.1 transcription/translation regulatory transformer protein RfaH [Leucothrix arctica]
MSQNQNRREWYLLNCKPKQDERAEENLNNQGYITFRPTLTLKKKRRNKEVLVQESLFPRYLFIYLDKENDNWAPISSTLGVSSIVRFGQEPAKATDELVAQLKQRMLLQESMSSSTPRPDFKEGEVVAIDEGPLKGLNGVFSGYASDERVIVLLNLLSQQSKVTLRSEYVKKSLAS